MILKRFLFICADTIRSTIYLQELIRQELYPAYCLILPAKTTMAMKQKSICTGDNPVDIIERILLKENIPFSKGVNGDINSAETARELQDLPQPYAIYSGYGGCILHPHLFTLGKKFIHVHAGTLPAYRGSTTMYYSLLNENKIGAAAIFMNEGIDQGDIIFQEEFSISPEWSDIDNLIDPYLRAQVLIKAVRLLHDNEKYIPVKQNQLPGGETYYIIHPVLKHLALLKIE